jgi:hypothetical protein
MSRFRDSRGFERRALRAAGVLLLVLVSTIALTLACTSEQDDVTTTALVAPLEPPHVIERLAAPQPPPALSLPIPPAYQPPRNA